MQASPSARSAGKCQGGFLVDGDRDEMVLQHGADVGVGRCRGHGVAPRRHQLCSDTITNFFRSGALEGGVRPFAPAVLVVDWRGVRPPDPAAAHFRKTKNRIMKIPPPPCAEAFAGPAVQWSITVKHRIEEPQEEPVTVTVSRSPRFRRRSGRVALGGPSQPRISPPFAPPSPHGAGLPRPNSTTKPT